MMWAYPPGNLPYEYKYMTHWIALNTNKASHLFPSTTFGLRKPKDSRGPRPLVFFLNKGISAQKLSRTSYFLFRSLQQDLSYLVYLNWLQFSNMCPISINILTILPLDLVDIHVWVQKTKPWWRDIRQAFQVNCLAPRSLGESPVALGTGPYYITILKNYNRTIYS